MRTCAFVFIVLIAAVSHATPVSANYLWSFNAGSPSSTNFGTAPTIGYQASSVADAQAFTTSTSAYASVVLLSSPGTGSGKTVLSKRYWINALPDLNTFYVQVHAASGYTPDSIDFRIWCPISTGTPLARALTVKVVYDPVGDLAGTVLGTVATTTGNSQASPTKKWNLPVYKTDTPINDGAGYILECSVVPEPGSLAALVTGCGIVALTRCGWRRRK